MRHEVVTPCNTADHKGLRVHNYNGGTPNRWRRGTEDEWREILHSRRAEMYQRNDILCCDSSLVDELIKAANNGMLDATPPGGATAPAGVQSDLGSGFSYDEIRNMYPDPEDWDAEKCKEWLDDHGVEICEDVNDPDLIDDVRSAVRDNAEPAEVYEWWRVSSWLCEQLHAISEVTIDNGYGHWWGRQATGQGYLMDGTLQQVAARFDS